MQITSPERIVQFRNLLQSELFPVLESVVGPLSKQSRLLVAVASLEPLASFVESRPCSTGRPPSDRLCIATALFAKAIYNLPSVEHLIQRLQQDTQLLQLCGWRHASEVPSASTFSRAFSEFAHAGLPTQVHAALVRRTQSKAVHDYIARDSTAIPARERIVEQKSKTPPPPKPPAHKPYKTKDGMHQRRARRQKGPHPRAQASQRGVRLERQQHMTLDQMLADLPRECGRGVKTDKQGDRKYWRGYKFHWDVSDHGRIPISCVLTGASLHDSQVAIPLMRMSAERIRWRYELMDSAYDAQLIREQISKRGHEALIQPNPAHARSKRENAFSEDDKQRFKKRTIVEQLNARLKDEFGGRLIYVRGAVKIMAHLMFGVVAITVDQLLRFSG